MNVSCPHCHRYFAVAEFVPGAVKGCPHCMRNVFLPNEEIPDAFLVPLEGDAANNRIPMTARMIIGRSNECDIQVLDGNISRQHAEILFEKGRFFVRDLGSRNGVQLNEAKVGEATLKHNDIVRMGGRNFRFELVAELAVAAPTPRPPGATAVEVTEVGARSVTKTDPLDERATQPSSVPVTEHGLRLDNPSTDKVIGIPGNPPAAGTTLGAGAYSTYDSSVLGLGASVILRATDPADAIAAAAMAAGQAAAPSPQPAPAASEAPTVPVSPVPVTAQVPAIPAESAGATVRTQLNASDAYQPDSSVDGVAARAFATLQTIYRVTEDLAGVTDIDTLLARILGQVLKAVPADRAYVILKDDAGAFQVRAAQFREQRHAENQMMVSRTLLDRAVDKQISLLVADAQVEFDAQVSIVSQGIRSVMCAPLVIGTHAFGAISVDTLRSRNAFDQEDLKMLTAIARQASVGLENLRLLKRVEEDTRTRGILERYLSPELVEQVVNRKVDLKPGGQLSELTILFSDIRGFTAMSEKLHPTEVVELINEYFSIMVEVLFRWGGTLDKFIGDSIMAFWGAPVKREDDNLRAVRCALEMQAQLAQFNTLMASTDQQQLEVGIGINTGMAVAGNIGSVRRFEYTILGDAVNVASRLQGLATGGQVLISEATYKRLAGAVPCNALPAAELKGREGLVHVYSVVR